MSTTHNLLIERSRVFAHKAHGAINHERKYTGDPYTVHLQAVARLVEGVSSTPEMIAAAWLHDTVEDTGVTLSEIEAQFGLEVAALVSDLTDVSRPEDGNRQTRKALDRAHLAASSPQAKTVKLADLIDNAQSIEQYDPKFAKTYMREKQLLLEVLQEGNPHLLAQAVEIVDAYFAQ